MQETWVWSLGWEDQPGKGNNYPLQYSGLENSMDCIVHRIAKSHITESLSFSLFTFTRTYCKRQRIQPVFYNEIHWKYNNSTFMPFTKLDHSFFSPSKSHWTSHLQSGLAKVLATVLSSLLEFFSYSREQLAIWAKWQKNPTSDSK